MIQVFGQQKGSELPMILKLKKSTLKIVSISLLVAFILVLSTVMFVSSIGANDVELSTPTNATWFGSGASHGNYTPGFVFNWSDAFEPTTIKQANCTLYMNTSSTGLVDPLNSYGTFNVSAVNTTLVHMNHTINGTLGGGLAQNNTKFFWTVECVNLASQAPSRFSPLARTIYHDDTKPFISRGGGMGLSFVNNTYISASTVRLELTVNDSTDLDGFQFSCSITNVTDQSEVLASGFNLDNATLTNITWTPRANTNNSFYVNCSDPAGNSVRSDGYTVILDSTTPDVNLTSPSDNNVTNFNDVSVTAVNITINFTFTELNVNASGITLYWNGTAESINLTSNCTAGPPAIPPKYNCSTMKNLITNTRNLQYNFSVKDNAGTIGWSAQQNISVDLDYPYITIVKNFTISDSILAYSVFIQDFNPESCIVEISNKTNVLVNNVTGTLQNTSAAGLTECRGTINGTNIGLEGNFTLQFKVNDSLNRINATNKTGLMVDLFNGWNLVSWSDISSTGTNNTLQEICRTVGNCSSTSWFNNSAAAKSFVTYSERTPGINNGTPIERGRAFFINVNRTEFLIMNNYMPSTLPTQGYLMNLSITTGGWNILGLPFYANVSSVLNATTNRTSEREEGTANVTYASWVDIENNKYITCRKSISKCSASSSLPEDIPLKPGYAIWVLGANNVTINKATIRG